ncbi:hypothetical protein HUG10_21135 (plasmid) [Halorarum halophilum]|uniref:Uncharacterized protein n=1 Tax=Halorarum halophilum TaxID=2743090 RepID=A0A7D5H478_9EURY|nr:hypothetical protein [Halobaculum halophilum]QLG30093.1 hypothetical protein HUG10_21135 [Halobaculum halophilum]
MTELALVRAMRATPRRCAECGSTTARRVPTVPHDVPSRRRCSDCGTERPNPNDDRNWRKEDGEWVLRGEDDE